MAALVLAASGLVPTLARWEVPFLRKGQISTPYGEHTSTENGFIGLGRLEVSPEGWPLWRTPVGREGLCQLRANNLVATDAAQRDRASLIGRLRTVLQSCRSLDMDCTCIARDVRQCTSLCGGPVTNAVGVVLGLPRGGQSTAFAEPAALTPEGNLRLGEALLSPHDAYKGPLSSGFPGVLKTTLPRAESWLGHILSGCAGLQVAIP